MPPPEITIAIPYYRNRKYLGPAVASVFAQTGTNWRLIVSDGSGSNDPTIPALLASAPHDRARYLPSAAPLDMAENWNRCLDAAETDLVTLLHDDDELLPDYVARMSSAAAEHPDAAAFFCEAQIIGPEGQPLFSFPDHVKRYFRPGHGRRITVRGQHGLRAVMGGNFIMCPTLCYRLSRLRGLRFAKRWSQVLDLDVTSRLILADECLVGLPEQLYAYRRHPENTTAGQTESLLRFHEERAIFGEIASRAGARGWKRAARTARGRTVIKLHLVYRAIHDLVRGRWAAARDKASLLGELLVGR
jgi:glycosyltransferase involved in cell wall biosynthesis